MTDENNGKDAKPSQAPDTNADAAASALTPEQDDPKLVQAAVKFMRDPKVATAPMTKKIAFLESKGLSAAQIQQVMAEIYGGSAGGLDAGLTKIGAPPAIPASAYSPIVQERTIVERKNSWLELAGAAVVTSALTVGIYHTLISYQHLLPEWLRPVDK